MPALLDNWYQGRTLVLGHRGASADAPMNTLPAFELALAQGADGVELDVWLSKDRVPVVIHDSTVDHTTDGSGYVWDMTLAELRELDASFTFADKYSGTRIPTLNEVFEAVGQQLFINVEIKSDSAMLRGVEQVVADCITQHNLDKRVLVSSFSGQILRRFRTLKPNVPIGFLYVADTPQSEFEQLAGIFYEALHPNHEQLDAGAIGALRQVGYRVHTWTVNEPARALELRRYGVDAIITDKPGAILKAIKRV